jgi:hypothetical protein
MLFDSCCFLTYPSTLNTESVLLSEKSVKYLNTQMSLFRWQCLLFDRLCGLVAIVPGYRTEMYCASYEVQTEFIYVMQKKVDRLCGLVTRVPGYRTEMYCASCEVRIEFICYVEESRPPLWSSGQRSEFLATDPEVWARFPALPDFLRSSGSGMRSIHPREYNLGATWKKK